MKEEGKHMNGNIGVVTTDGLKEMWNHKIEKIPDSRHVTSRKRT